MDNETILKLVNAGYTKAEISAMFADASEGAETDESGAKEQTVASAENASEVKESVGEQFNVNAAITALNDTVAGLTATVKAMQTANVKGAVTESPKATDKVKATMDSFIFSL